MKVWGVIKTNLFQIDRNTQNTSHYDSHSKPKLLSLALKTLIVMTHTLILVIVTHTQNTSCYDSHSNTSSYDSLITLVVMTHTQNTSCYDSHSKHYKLMTHTQTLVLMTHTETLVVMTHTQNPSCYD